MGNVYKPKFHKAEPLSVEDRLQNIFPKWIRIIPVIVPPVLRYQNLRLTSKHNPQVTFVAYTSYAHSHAIYPWPLFAIWQLCTRQSVFRKPTHVYNLWPCILPTQISQLRNWQGGIWRHFKPLICLLIRLRPFLLSHDLVVWHFAARSPTHLC